MTATPFLRNDNSLIARWWWTVDRMTLTALMVLIALGALMALAASPAVADRIGLDSFHFARRQFVFLPFALVVMLGVSLLSPANVRRLGLAMFAGFYLLTAATLVIGVEIKGAHRWLHLGGLSLQPSEFLKPAFAVLVAWMLAEHRLDRHFPGRAIAFGLLVFVLAILARQPDIGMSAVILGTWGVQFFLAGLPFLWVAVLGLGGVGLLGAAYMAHDHVRSRIDRFFDPSGEEPYQIMRSMQAFKNGGLFGTGPGEGKVKSMLPDAHTDFVFSVVGEEFGLIAALLVVGIFAFVVLRGFARVFKDEDIFVMLATSGLLTQFGLQAIINMSSALKLIPPKGMTLPFMSYGGSSTVALALGMGMVLALTRHRPRAGGAP
ncbi:MAG: putative lipid II flippase FtsW [Magnetospirillum sp. WYHS-4]